MTRLKRRKELPSQNKEDVRFGTPDMVAQHRAARIAILKPDTIIEVGAGAGFQTQAFAQIAKTVIAIDIDKERLERAELPPNVIAIAGDALDSDILERIKKHCEGKIAVFLDPERPPSSLHRTLAEIRPDIQEFLEKYSSITPDIAIELPPFLAKEELAQIAIPNEREYLSVDGKLNRLTLYFGALRQHDVSCTRLPDGESIGADSTDDETGILSQDQVAPRHLLDPDAALVHAGLVAEALKLAGNPRTESIGIGNKIVLLTEAAVKSPFFKHYNVIAAGPRNVIEGALRHTGTLILHGRLSQDEQRNLLRELQPLCKGDKRTHLFLARQWYLCSQVRELS